MQSLEEVVAALLERDGYWVRRRFKVELTKAEKKQIGRPSAPRWELDVIGYKPAQNELLVVECKAYFDSFGVQLKDFHGPSKSNRYKLFNEPLLRSVVFSRLTTQLQTVGACQSKPTVRLVLAAGRIKPGDEQGLRAHFQKNNWELWDKATLAKMLEDYAAGGYEDSVVAAVAKLLAP